ncbi:MAG: hypothetical protein WBA88_16765 [Pseudaminobacter sp.]
MNRHILAIAAIFVTSGVTAADGISSRYVYGDAAPQINAPIETSRIDYPSSAFAIKSTVQNGNTWNDRYGDRAPSSAVVSPTAAIDYSEISSIGASRPHSLGASPRILHGSN